MGKQFKTSFFSRRLWVSVFFFRYGPRLRVDTKGKKKKRGKVSYCFFLCRLPRGHEIRAQPERVSFEPATVVRIWRVERLRGGNYFGDKLVVDPTTTSSVALSLLLSWLPR